MKIVNSIPAEKPILFLPDRNLGNYVKQQTGRENMKIWQGSCIVHATFPVRRLLDAKAAYPEAIVVAHPECPEPVLQHADFIGSTSAIIDYCAASPARGVHCDDRKRRQLFARTRRARQEVSITSPTKTAIAANARSCA